MPRIFDRSQADAPVAPPRTASRSAARALASAFAALLVSLLVVSRSVAALGGGAGSFNNVFGVAAVNATDPQTQASPVGSAGGAASPGPGEQGTGAGGTEGVEGPTEGVAGSEDPGGVLGTRPRPTPAPGAGGAVPGATPAPSPGGTAPPPPAQVVELTDDDAGASLFNLPAMMPGQAYSRCITVTYRGVVPARVALQAGAEGQLAAALGAVVEVGAQGGFDDCTGFTPERVLFAGTLAELASVHGPGTAGLAAFSPAASPESRTFRFTFDIDDAAPQGATARADLSWTTTAS